jgi:putative Holliday junction resolvase
LNASIPNSPGRVAGIDFGTVRIGVAISDPDRTLASPLENYNRRDLPQDAKYFAKLAADERIVLWVVGLPVHTNGRESQKSREAREFGNWLQRTTAVPVQYFDERYTTVEAEEMLMAAQFTKARRKERLDKLAAQIMLAAFLESGGHADSDRLKGLDD